MRGGGCRQALRQHGVDEGMLRAHVRMAEPDLAVAVGVRENARSRDLAPRPRRRRAEDETDAGRLGDAPPFGVVGSGAALVGDDPRRLRDVERRPAADPDDRVEPLVAHPLGQPVGERERRLARPLDETGETSSAGLGRREGGNDVVMRRNGLLDDDESCPGAERRECRRELRDDAVAEGDLDGKVRAESRHRVAHVVVMPAARSAR